MKTIRYEFCDGTINEVEVSDELYAVHEQLVQEEKRNHKRETRRHISLDYLRDKGIDFEDKGSDCLVSLIRQEDGDSLRKAMALLSDKQRELVEKVVFEGMTLTAFAELEHVTQQAVSQKLAVILKKLQKLLQKTL